MTKKNGGINDRPDESGEQGHADGNSGIDNRIGGDVVPAPPETLTPEQERQRGHHAPVPDRRRSNVL